MEVIRLNPGDTAPVETKRLKATVRQVERLHKLLEEHVALVGISDDPPRLDKHGNPLPGKPPTTENQLAKAALDDDVFVYACEHIVTLEGKDCQLADLEGNPLDWTKLTLNQRYKILLQLAEVMPEDIGQFIDFVIRAIAPNQAEVRG